MKVNKKRQTSLINCNLPPSQEWILSKHPLTLGGASIATAKKKKKGEHIKPYKETQKRRETSEFKVKSKGYLLIRKDNLTQL